MRYPQVLVKGCKIISALILVLYIAFSLLAMKTNQVVDDVWNTLGIREADAKHNINVSFNSGYLSYYGAKNAGKIVAGDRVALVNQIVAYAKKYYNSAEFKKEYKLERDRYKKPELFTMPETPETIRERERTRLEKALKDAEAGLNSTNPKIKNSAPMRIENVKKELAAVDDPNNPRIKRLIDDLNRNNDALKKDYNDKLEKFEQDHPEDPNILLKKRLQEVLDMTADVDYSAELKDAGKFKVFVNSDYERKPKEWKLAFRAGKPTTDAIRAAAQQWLKELK
jgi:outer membrane translocation and assembly module TamA